MVDATGIIEGGGEFNLANILAFLVTAFVSLFMIVFGVNSNNLQLLALGVAFLFLTLVGAFAMEFVGNYFRSPGTIGMAALAYWGALIFLNPGFLFNVTELIPLSFAVPSGSYASSALSGVSSGVVTIVNGFLAPHGESFAIGGAAVILIAGLNQVLKNKPASVFVAVGVMSLVFGQLHGVRNVTFFVSAVIFMFVTLGVLTFTDIGVEIPFASQLIVTWLLFAGVHAGWNRSASGLGIVGFYQSILTTPAPMTNATFLIIGFELFLLLFAVLELWRWVDGRLSVLLG